MIRIRGAARALARTLIVAATIAALGASCGPVHDADDGSARMVEDADPEREISFTDVKGYILSTVSYGPEPEHLADLYMPAEADRVFRDKTPLILYVHGGSWILGSRKNKLPGPIIALTKKGWAVASVDYRLAGTSTGAPAQEQDVARAIVWFKANAAQLGIDPTVVVLAGHSAGGHLATLVGTACKRHGDSLACAPEIEQFNPRSGEDSPRPDVNGIISLSAIYDVAEWATASPRAAIAVAALAGCAPTGPCSNPLITSQEPLRNLDPTDPPVYVYHAVDDDIVPYGSQAVVAVRALEANFGDRASRMAWFDSGESGGHNANGANPDGIAQFVEAVRSGSL